MGVTSMCLLQINKINQYNRRENENAKEKHSEDYPI